MKTIKVLAIGCILFFASTAKAQVAVNVNIGTPPVWGPVGYAEARYYYIPDIQTYYDINTAMFIYMGPRGWIHAAVLPSGYASFDLYSGYKVVLNYRGDNPYRYYEVHKVKFPKGYKKYHQKPYKLKQDNGNHYGQIKNGKGSKKSAISYQKIKFSNDNHDNNGGNHNGGHGKGKGKNK